MSDKVQKILDERSNTLNPLIGLRCRSTRKNPSDPYRKPLFFVTFIGRIDGYTALLAPFVQFVRAKLSNQKLQQVVKVSKKIHESPLWQTQDYEIRFIANLFIILYAYDCSKKRQYCPAL